MDTPATTARTSRAAIAIVTARERLPPSPRSAGSDAREVPTAPAASPGSACASVGASDGGIRSGRPEP